jgi:hypothetical protein
VTSRQHSTNAYLALLHAGRVVKVRGEVCAWLHAHGAATRNELDRALGGGRPNPPHSRRLAELREMGVIHVVGERDGSDLWDVTEVVPAWVPRSKRPKSSRVDRLAAYERLRKLLTHPRARIMPDGTIEVARSIIEATEGEASP